MCTIYLATGNDAGRSGLRVKPSKFVANIGLESTELTREYDVSNCDLVAGIRDGSLCIRVCAYFKGDKFVLFSLSGLP